MEIQEFLHLIKNKKQTIAIVTILFVLCAVAFTFVQPLRYSSVSKVLIVQTLPKGVDPYQVSKSNEYVASLLTQVIPTNSFYKEVLNSGFNIDKAYFPETSDKQMKLWKKTVRASSNSSGIITIKVYHSNRVQVNQISQAINFILKSKHQLYHGFGDLVKIKIIEQPVTSDRPIKPNVFINVSVAFAFGFLLSLTYIYLFPDSRYNLRLRPQGDNNLASNDIRSGQDEFDIENYNNNSLNVNYDNEQIDKINNIKKEISKIKQTSREDTESAVVDSSNEEIEPPNDLPVMDQIEKESKKEEEKNSLSNRQPRDIERQGNMDNIINQTDQRG